MNLVTHNLHEFIEQNLNTEQRKAVLHSTGPLLVVAGAGSGKTRVITARIAHLVLSGQAQAHSIVALTFTNKAAQEMQHRIRKFLENSALVELPFIGTFHSFCLRFLKSHADKLPTPFASILDEDDQQKILNNIIKRNGLTKKISPKQLAYKISLVKNQSINPDQSSELTQDKLIYEIYRAYEHEKMVSRSLDFDDLLVTTVKLLKKDPELLSKTQTTLSHVLVDEYQDTNVVQHELLKLLTLSQEKQLAVQSICVVGDEDQSIYSWRGATVTNILNFKQDFSDTTTIKIEQNYRSVQPILEIANQVIINNEQRNPKNLWSTRQGSDRVLVLACSSEYQEADALASFFAINSKINNNENGAILYRAHYQSRSIEEALIKRGIPYTIIGGIQFYERKEIKDLMSYLRLIINPFDRTALLRVINCPSRGLGEAFEEQFYNRWQAEPFMKFNDIAQTLIKEGTLTPKKASALKSFIAVFDHLQPSDRPSTVLEVILKKTNYLSYLKEFYDEQEAETKIENVKELMQAIRHFETTRPSTSIGEFLDDVALLQEKIDLSKKDKEHAILLMTLHGAKGLEFDNVAIAGLNEDVLPSSRSVYSPESLEEERRLLYVGITRARERLVLSYARNRHMYGQMNEYAPSRFIREIPTSCFTRHDIGYCHQEQMDRIFRQWLAPEHSSSPSVITFTKTQVISKQAQEQEIQQESQWKKNQPVMHTTFGVGTIQEVERKKDGKLYITAQFKSGIKKIESSFLKTI